MNNSFTIYQYFSAKVKLLERFALLLTMADKQVNNKIS